MHPTPTLTTAQIVDYTAGLLAERRAMAQRYLDAAAAHPGDSENLNRAGVLDYIAQAMRDEAGALKMLCLWALDTQAGADIGADISATGDAICHAAQECRLLALPPESQARVREAMARAAAQSAAQTPA